MCQTVFAPVKADAGSAIQTRKEPPPMPPASRRSRDDDDYDDDAHNPRKKRRAADDRYDDDDAYSASPKRRAARDDDDWDDDDRSARSRRRGKSKAGLWIGIGGGVGAFLLVFLLMGFVWPAFFLSKRGSAAHADLLAYLPANSMAALGVDLSTQQQNPGIQKLPEMLRNLPQGPPPEVGDLLVDLLKNGDRLVVGGKFDDAIPSVVIVYRGRAPYDAEKIRKACQTGKTKTVAGKTCYLMNDGAGPGALIALADDKTIVLATQNLEGDFARAVANPKPVLSAELMSQISEVDRSTAWGVLLNEGKIKSALQQMKPQQLAKAPGADFAAAVAPLQNARGFCFWVEQKAGEKGGKFSLGVTCASGGDADTIQTKVADFWNKGGKMMLGMVRGFAAQVPAVGGLFDDVDKSFAVKRKGSLAYATIEISNQTAQALEQQQQQLLAGAFNPRGNQPPFNPPMNPPFNPPVQNPPANNPAANNNPPPAKAFPKPPAGMLVKNFSGVISKSSLKDGATNQPCKIHEVFLTAGKKYSMDLTSTKFDPFLRLELRAKKLAEDDNSAGGKNARITFTAQENGLHQLIVISRDGKFGLYRLKVQETP
jgi:hypothetical protein